MTGYAGALVAPRFAAAAETSASPQAAVPVVVPGKAEDVRPLLIGSTLPPVKLRSIDGKEFDLNRSVAAKPTVLIFYRGGWCPYCNTELANLRKAEARLVEMGYQLLAISPDTPAELKKSSDKLELKYALLSDSSMSAAQALGIAFKVEDSLVTKYKGFGIDLEKATGQNHHMLPVPAVFVLDTKGTIQFSHVNPNYRVRLAPEVLLAAAKAALPVK